MTSGARAAWVLALVSCGASACGGRSALSITPPSGIDASYDASYDAAVDAGDGGSVLPFEGPLEVIGADTLPSGELRVITLRNATDRAGTLEIHALDPETDRFERLCSAGMATNASLLPSLPAAPAGDGGTNDGGTASEQRRLLVERSDCGRPPTCPPREVSMIDLDCHRVGAPIANAVSWFPTPLGTTYVLRQGGDLLAWDERTGQSHVIATGVGSLRFDGMHTFWTVQNGEVIRRDLTGQVTGRASDAARALWLRPGTDEVAYDDAEGVHIWAATDPSPELVQAGACRPQYVFDALMFYSPCDTGSLTIADRGSGDRYTIADHVGGVVEAQWNDQYRHATYVVDPSAPVGPEGPVATRPWRDAWVFEPPDTRIHLASDVLAVRYLGKGRVGVIGNAHGEVGTLSIWTGGASSIEVAQGVVEMKTGQAVHAVLADFDGKQGRLLAVDAQTFSATDVSTGVPRQGYLVSATPPELVFVRDVDPILGTGTLEAYSSRTGEVTRLDTGVTPGFIRVSAPAPGAVIYAVFDGERSDVRFAPLAAM